MSERGKGKSFTVRVTASQRSDLERSAALSGRSLSAEIAARLDESLSRQPIDLRLVAEALESLGALKAFAFSNDDSIPSEVLAAKIRKAILQCTDDTFSASTDAVGGDA